MIGVTLFVIAVLSIAIWVVVEVKRLKHKLFAILLIGFLIFSYISFAYVFKEKEVDYKTIPGVIEASKIYMSWMISIGMNFGHITSNAIKMDWGANQSVENEIDVKLKKIK
jgi:hypothetical protein